MLIKYLNYNKKTMFQKEYVFRNNHHQDKITKLIKSVFCYNKNSIVKYLTNFTYLSNEIIKSIIFFINSKLSSGSILLEI